jgi:hypothetical protein
VESLLRRVDAAWAEDLGCSVDLLHAPGAHLVPGGADLAGYRGLYMARFDGVVLVYSPRSHEAAARRVLLNAAPDEVFSVRSCHRMAGAEGLVVLGPAWHGFVDVAAFRPVEDANGQRVKREGPELEVLRQACPENEWLEAGFGDPDGICYGLREGSNLVAAGNMTSYRGMPADVGVITHPAFRHRGHARRLVSYMTTDQLPAAGVVRYRALQANRGSLAIARSLGFIGRGESLAIRLRS